jgi:anti-sigma B factor antagonist
VLTSAGVKSLGRIAVDHRDGVVLLTVRGEHDPSNDEVLRDGLSAVLANGAAVVVDLSEASFIDSTVLHTLVRASRPTRDAPGHPLVVCARADGLAGRLLYIAGMHKVLRIADTVEDALSGAAARPAT